MKKIILGLLLLPSLVMANGPKYTYPSPPSPPGLDDEINNIYHDIRTTRVSYLSYTLAQIKTLSLLPLGTPVYCLDCSVSAVCVSTGTANYGFSDISGRTNSCH